MASIEQTDGWFEDDVPGDTRRVMSLWIRDVHTMIYCCHVNRYYFHGWQVPYVRVFGTIRSAVPFASTNTYRYEVDDGTASITCIYNLDWQLDDLTNDIIDKVISELEAVNLNRDSNKQEADANKIQQESQGTEQAEQRCIEWLTCQIINKGSEVRTQLDEGDKGWFIGSVRCYGVRREIRVLQIHRISSIEEEIGLILQYMDLYKAYLN